MSHIGFEEVPEHIFDDSETTKEQGDFFERAVVFILQNDPLWAQRFSDVWLWAERGAFLPQSAVCTVPQIAQVENAKYHRLTSPNRTDWSTVAPR